MTDSAPPAAGLEEASQREADPPGATGAGRLVRLLVGSELVGIFAPLVLLALAMATAFPGFASLFNIDALLATIAVISVVGLAQVSVLAIGHFNLALPAIGAFTGMVLGWLLQVAGLDWSPAVALALALAAVLGLVEGLVIALFRRRRLILPDKVQP